MIVLASDGFGFSALSQHPRYHAIAAQFSHVPWAGTPHIWDLILPAFMFMVGMSMPFSLGGRTAQGATFRQNLRHVTLRSLRLMVLSQILISIESNRLHFQIYNILMHIAVAYFLCFLIMQLKFPYQVVTAAALLVVYSSLLYLFPGPDGPFSQTGSLPIVIDRALMGHYYSSMGSYMDPALVVMGHTVIALFGVWAGDLVRSGRSRFSQLKILAIAMVGAFAGGLGLWLFMPFVTRLVNASFIFYVTGWTLGLFLVLYLVIDAAGYRKLAFPLTVVGSNSIFIYSISMDGDILRNWLDRSVAVFTGNFVFLGTFAPVAQSCAVLLVMWYLCYWLYQRKIFLRL
jgi:predicted acyltransferase